jgi:hypothetical protein
MTDTRKARTATPSARERASQKEVAQVERAMARARRSPNIESDPKSAPTPGKRKGKGKGKAKRRG